MRENNFQKKLIKRLENEFPGCLVLKNDANYILGIPDLIVLYKDKWFMLECKRHSKAIRSDAQKFWIKEINKMSSAYIIYPENIEEVFYEIHKTY